MLLHVSTTNERHRRLKQTESSLELTAVAAAAAPVRCISAGDAADAIASHESETRIVNREEETEPKGRSRLLGTAA